jgi:hypothetical protein
MRARLKSTDIDRKPPECPARKHVLQLRGEPVQPWNHYLAMN